MPRHLRPQPGGAGLSEAGSAGIGVTGQQVRAVSAGKTNVDIGVVYRGKVTTESPVAEHDLASEVNPIIDSSATLMLGPDIVDAKRRPADDRAVRMLHGPGSNGMRRPSGRALPDPYLATGWSARLAMM